MAKYKIEITIENNNVTDMQSRIKSTFLNFAEIDNDDSILVFNEKYKENKVAFRVKAPKTFDMNGYLDQFTNEHPDIRLVAYKKVDGEYNKFYIAAPRQNQIIAGRGMLLPPPYYFEQYVKAHEWEEEILEKIDNGEALSERELKELVFDGYEIERHEGENRRWTRTVESIVELCGRTFSISWEEGLTECQENGFYEQPVEVECHEYEKTITVKEWTPVEKNLTNEDYDDMDLD